MANLVNTFLSDENIRKMCPAKHLPPLTKTYELFRSPVVGKMSQAPSNPASMMRSLSEIQNIPYSSLKERYEEALLRVPNESVGVVSMNIEKFADKRRRIGFRTSKPIIIQQGNAPTGTQNVGGTQINVNQGTQGGTSGGSTNQPTKTRIQQDFDMANRKFQNVFLKNIRDDALTQGLTINRLSNSQIQQLNQTQREAYLQTIITAGAGAYDSLSVSDFAPSI
jgi:hypothetical protein